MSLVVPRVSANALSQYIGRDPTSSYPVVSLLVSWHHAQFWQNTAGETVIQDLGSTTGTYINQRRITGWKQLVPGDRVQIGPALWIFDGTMLQGAVTARGMQVDAWELVRTVPNGRAKLLDHISLAIVSGEFMMVAGNSGAGKTTLLKALAGVEQPQQGLIAYDGVPLAQAAPCLHGQFGYVPQGNSLHAMLPLERALRYAARLRMASDVRPEEITARITEVLAILELTAQRQQVIATLSVGQQRRANIAVELLTNPTLLLLDEPNAGLDPHLRRELAQLLRGLADAGQTVVLVTHEPHDLRLCDRLAFIGQGGQLCFVGTPGAALDYFGVTTFEDIYALLHDPSAAHVWRERFAHSPQALEQIAWRHQSLVPLPTKPSLTRPRWQLAWQQTHILAQRYAELLSRDRSNLALLLLQAPLIGLILTLVSQRFLFLTSDGPFEVQKVLFFMIIAAVWLGTNNAQREICKETEIAQRERTAGLGIVPYLLSKVLVLAGLCGVQTLVLVGMVVPRVGLPPASAGLFLPPLVELTMGVLLTNLAGMAMGLCISAFASTPDKATSLAPIILLPQILLAGVIFTVTGAAAVPTAFAISHWGMEALGTSTDLNHLYYVQLIKIYPVLLKHPALAPLSLGGRPPPFNPYDYDSDPSLTRYSPKIGNGVSWADAVPSRRVQLLHAWTGLLVLCGAFLVLAAFRQRTKDPY